MKLIKCHIENFGKLSDFTYDFTDGCNTVCEENGWGKSTLAAFLRVMLFGFRNEGKRDPLENERKRYSPWQKGVYGGELQFESEGKQYSVSSAESFSLSSIAAFFRVSILSIVFCISCPLRICVFSSVMRSLL